MLAVIRDRVEGEFGYIKYVSYCFFKAIEYEKQQDTPLNLLGLQLVIIFYNHIRYRNVLWLLKKEEHGEKEKPFQTFFNILSL